MCWTAYCWWYCLELELTREEFQFSFSRTQDQANKQTQFCIQFLIGPWSDKHLVERSYVLDCQLPVCWWYQCSELDLTWEEFQFLFSLNQVWQMWSRPDSSNVPLHRVSFFYHFWFWFYFVTEETQLSIMHSCRRGTYNSKKICKMFWSQKVP